MKTCVICGNLYKPSRFTIDRQLYCSPNCSDKARHSRDREKRNAKMRERHEKNRKRDNEINRKARQRRIEYYKAYDRVRWVGERKQRNNRQRRHDEQKERIDEPWKKLIRCARQRAKAKNVPFCLTNEWGASIWTGKCALTELDFYLGLRGNGPKCLSPSIDRIKPELGYIPENCRFVIWSINALKHDGTDSLMYQVAEALLKYRDISIG